MNDIRQICFGDVYAPKNEIFLSCDIRINIRLKCTILYFSNFNSLIVSNRNTACSKCYTRNKRKNPKNWELRNKNLELRVVICNISVLYNWPGYSIYTEIVFVFSAILCWLKSFSVLQWGLLSLGWFQ